MRSPSVPFQLAQVHGGLSTAHGVVYVDDEDLVLEVQTGLIGGLFQQAGRTFRFDLTDLESVAYKRGFRTDRVTLRTRPLDRLGVVPGVKNGALCLRIARSERAALDRLLDLLDLWRTD